MLQTLDSKNREELKYHHSFQESTYSCCFSVLENISKANEVFYPETFSKSETLIILSKCNCVNLNKAERLHFRITKPYFSFYVSSGVRRRAMITSL